MIVTSGENIQQILLNPKYPIFKVEYYDTPYGVPTRGFKFRHYDDPDQTSSSTFSASQVVHEGKDNILAYDWGFGGPAGVSNTGYFKSQFYGWFYAKYAGIYTFRIIKDPGDYAEFHIKRETSGSITDPSDVSSYGVLGASHRVASDWGATHSGLEIIECTLTITSTQDDKWHPWVLNYAQREKGSYIALQYLEPDTAIATNGDASDNDVDAVYHPEPVQHYKVMSAGVAAFERQWVNADDAEFISPTILDSVIDINLSQTANQSNTINLSIPYYPNALTTSGLKGFRKSHNGLYYDDNNDVYLRQGRLVKFYSGYSTSGTSPEDWNYIQRFEGIITDISVARSLENSTLQITCQDPLYFAVKAINRNYPDQLSYPLFGFLSASGLNQPNGATRPSAYDAWLLEDVVRDLMIKSSIDPTKLYDRKYYIDRNGLLATGGYLIDGNDIQLKRRIRYGHPYGLASDPNSDDKYIWSFNFGDYIYDNLTKIVDTYGFILEANHNGSIICSALESYNTSPVESGWASTGVWTKNIDIKADGGKYFTPVNSGYTITGFMDGSRFRVNFVKHYTNSLNDLKEWSLPLMEFPESNYDIGMDVNGQFGIGSNYKFGNLFGRFPSGPPNGRFSDTLTYVDASIYIRPLVSFTINKINYKYNDDYPSITNDQYIDLGADIYFGQVMPPNYTDLVTSSLVYSDYIRPNRLSNREHTITLSTPVSVVSGSTYAFRFITKELGDGEPGVTNAAVYDDCLFSVQNCAIRTQNNQVFMAMGLRKFNNPNPRNDNQNYEFISSDFQTDGLRNLGVFANMTFIGQPARSCNVNIYGRDSIGGYPLATSYSLNMNYYDPSKTGLRYPSDGPDYSGQNPCVFEIYGQDISNNIVDNFNSSYGNYIIEIEDTSSVTSGTKVSSIESIENDIYNPVFTFTDRNSITNITYNESIQDIRNDIIVIGDLIGAFKDYTTNEIINAKNPDLQYIYSRAVDLSSINDPESLNNVGHQAPFIIYEPAVIDQDHADWLAQAVLYRYNKYRQIPQWDSFGIPILRTMDLVSVIGLNQNSARQWIESISENISLTDYQSSFTSSPYTPWAAYQPKAAPDIADFDDLPFVNVRLTDTNDYLRGYDNQERTRYDVYELETSGTRLRLKYDQVIDGDIIVKVMSKNILGIENEQPVAYLVGQFQDGVETPEYREWGVDYELLWDGVDQLGNARRMLGQYVSEITESGGLVTIDDNDYIQDYRNPGFYTPSGEYFVRFTIFPRSNSISRKTINTTDLNSTFNAEIYDRLSLTGETYEQTWQVMWGDLPQIRMSVDGAHASASGGADRNLTYYPNNVFYEDENGGSGVKFNYSIANNNNGTRVLYYSASVDHIWSVGHAFRLDETYESYAQSCQGNWAMRLGVSDYNLGFGYDLAEHDSSEWNEILPLPVALADRVRILSNNSKWSEGNQPLELPSRFKYDVSDSMIYVWDEQPYVTYQVENYIETTLHRYNDTNPIEFYYNPESALAGGWNFLQAPDMSESTYNAFRRFMALSAYFNGPTQQGLSDGRIQLMVAHSFQVRTYIWDGTGRILQSDLQNIAREMEPHSHRFIEKSAIGTITSDADLKMDEHTHNLDDSRVVLTANHATFKPMGGFDGSQRIWNMTVTGLSSMIAESGFNMGIGYCNIKGMPSYGAFTWHGWWKHSDYSANLIDEQIPFAHWSEPYAKHWCRYPMPTESGVGGKLFYGIPHFGGVDTTDGDYDIDDVFSSSVSELIAVTGGLNYLEDKHTHLPIYEGLDNSIDPFGFVEYVVTGDSLNLTTRTIGPITPLLWILDVEIGRTSWYNACHSPDLASPLDSGRLPFLKQTASFPKIWYKLNLTLPWDSSATQNYWNNFLIESGFSFFKGGYSDFLPDKNTGE